MSRSHVETQTSGHCSRTEAFHVHRSSAMPRSTQVKIDTDKFRQQLKTVQKKANNLARYEAEVYVLVRRHGRCHEYTSSRVTAWRLTQAQIVNSYSATECCPLTKYRCKAIPYRSEKRLLISKTKRTTDYMKQRFHRRLRRSRRHCP